MSMAIIGSNSQIAKEFETIVSPVHVHKFNRENIWNFYSLMYPYTKYLFCAGYMSGSTLNDLSDFLEKNKQQTYEDTYYNIVKRIDKILDEDEYARICVIGSESAYFGSHDTIYAAAKAALHLYVETKKLKPTQQLVCVSPWIIEDAGMTIRRLDVDNLKKLKEEHPKKRFISSREVALMCYHLLFVDQGYTTNTIIRMNGGIRK